MPSTVSRPVAAALGIVPTVLDGVRRLPGKAVQLPVHAVSHALTSFEAARQGYDDLAERGERLLARLRGTSFDEVEDRVEDALQGTPLAAPYDAVEDALEDAVEGVAKLVRSSTTRARAAGSTAARSAGDGLSKTADAVGATAQEVAPAAAKVAPPKKAAAEKPAPGKKAAPEKAALEKKAAPEKGPAAPKPEAGKGTATPKATQPDDTRIDTAAAPAVVETVEQVSERLGGTPVAHDELPLPDYDHLTLGSLRGRIRSLDLPQLVQLRDYEKAHADRLPVVTMFDNRIAKLADDPTAPLSGGDPTAKAPDGPAPAKGGSKVQPATSGPAQNPPTGGVPTNPAQPR